MYDEYRAPEKEHIMAVAADLATIKTAVAELAFARVETTGQPAAGFIGTLDTIDAMIERWTTDTPRTAHDHYQLGLLIGMLAYMAACKVTEDGTLEPIPVIYPDDNPVAVAASGMRDAVLSFTAP